MGCVYLCVCVQTHSYLGSLSSFDGRGAFSVTDVEMAQDVCGVRLMCCPAFSEITEHTMALSIYRLINIFTYD